MTAAGSGEENRFRTARWLAGFDVWLLFLVLCCCDSPQLCGPRQIYATQQRKTPELTLLEEQFYAHFQMAASPIMQVQVELYAPLTSAIQMSEPFLYSS